MRNALFNLFAEQSSSTIEVESPTSASTPAPAAQPVRRTQDFTPRRSVSAAPTLFETPIRDRNQVNLQRRGQQTPQSRFRKNSIIPTKRRMENDLSDDRTSPSLSRIMSENIRPAADGNIFSSSGSSAPPGFCIVPGTISSNALNLTPPAGTGRPVSSSSASSQATTRDVQQDT